MTTLRKALLATAALLTMTSVAYAEPDLDLAASYALTYKLERTYVLDRELCIAKPIEENIYAGTILVGKRKSFNFGAVDMSSVTMSATRTAGRHRGDSWDYYSVTTRYMTGTGEAGSISDNMGMGLGSRHSSAEYARTTIDTAVRAWRAIAQVCGSKPAF